MWTTTSRSRKWLDGWCHGLADWCAINLLRPGNEIELVANAHVDPDKQIRIQQFADQYPLEMDATEGTPAVIREGSSLFYSAIPEQLAASNARLRRLTSLGLTSLVIAPLQTRGHVLGAITLARSDPKHVFTQDDLLFVEELAQRVALTVDSGQLYTATRDAETRLRQLNESLEERVAERTAELERSNRELDQFAYVASHDLKAPLRAIANLAAWIENDSGAILPESSRRHLETLRGRVVRMERLLDDLLSYARVGRENTVFRYVDTGELVREIIELVVPARFEMTIDDAMPDIYTQQAPLETVLRNLIENAVKHHRTGPGHINVSARSQEDFVEFTVADDGPGIAPEYHERIFEMFQTLQPRDQIEGSGIGLAIVKKLVESQGGHIVVKSDIDQGARFIFTWPLLQTDAVPNT